MTSRLAAPSSSFGANAQADWWQCPLCLALGDQLIAVWHYYDVWALLTTREMDEDRLCSAIAATFKRRGTVLPSDTPDALAPAFAADGARRTQWIAFMRNVEREAPALDVLVAELEAPLMTIVRLAST